MVTKYVIVLAFLALLVVADFFIQKRTGSVKVTEGHHSDMVLQKSKTTKAEVSGKVDGTDHPTGIAFAEKPSHIGMR